MCRGALQGARFLPDGEAWLPGGGGLQGGEDGA